jgi:hypothetical protein
MQHHITSGSTRGARSLSTVSEHTHFNESLALHYMALHYITRQCHEEPRGKAKFGTEPKTKGIVEFNHSHFQWSGVHRRGGIVMLCCAVGRHSKE